MTPAQAAFGLALALVAGSVLAFAAYVVSSTMWAGRWYRRRR